MSGSSSSGPGSPILQKQKWFPKSTKETKPYVPSDDMFDSTTASDEPVVTHEAGAQVITISSESESDGCAAPIVVSAVSH